MTQIGHSTLLVQLDGVNFLTDPTWAKRTGPFGGLIGVGRYTPPPMRMRGPAADRLRADLPRPLRPPGRADGAAPGSACSIPRFVVPLGLNLVAGRPRHHQCRGARLGRVRDSRRPCASSARPRSTAPGRTLADQGRRLWSSWAVLGSKRFYFAGDTGYYRHFTEIGDALGPVRPGRAADRVAHAAGDRAPRPHLARGGPAGDDRTCARRASSASTGGRSASPGSPNDEPPRRLAAEIERRGLDPAANPASRDRAQTKQLVTEAPRGGRAPTSSGKARMIRCGTTGD